jgi:hypothetical protein
MRTPVLTCLVLAFALSAAAAAAAEAPVPAPAADPAAATLLASPVSSPTCAAATATPALRDTTPEWLEKACCGNRCSSDSQCTAICGGPGQCVQVNSCCRRCICSQT